MIKKNILFVLSILLLVNCSNDDEMIAPIPEDTTEIIYIIPVVIHIIHSGEAIGTGYQELFQKPMGFRW